MDDIMSDASQAIEPVNSHLLHDLRNRLTVVKGVAQLLDRQVRQDDWQRERIIARVDRLQDEIALLQHVVDAFDSGDAARPSDRTDDLFH